MGEHSLHYRLEDAVPASSLSLCISSRPQRRRRRLSLIRASSSSSLLEMVGLSIGEKYFIQGGIAQDIRSNGRKRLTPRPINVKTGVISQANGSARVRMGATDVIASVKAELGRPTALQPDKGKVFINVDCSPTAAPMFEDQCIYTYCKAVVFFLLQGRGGEELSAELSVALRCCLLGGKSGSGAGIDLSSLVVVEGKICWDLYIDGLVVSSDGNLLDALGAAIKASQE
ncbi:exosome complex exonuclease RRP42-like isoform X3 [Pyrus x bretschneideri]|uniref:exosome complex exonuclease RRP42-like isoform X3 n=1 Tax=Pyrus x bretschneideri TaxID=225117 RepID=UPI002030106F|nr:exosome complex exonuclease RRP42-like isoform X3 [Pyrus x bretschneideri]